MMKNELGNYFRDLRKKKNETLHQLAMATDIDSPLLSKIERGLRLRTKDQLKRLAKHYKLSEESLRIKHTAEKILKEYGKMKQHMKPYNLLKYNLNTL